MIVLERNKYLKINENCYLCHLQKWGSEEYFYVVAVNTYPKFSGLDNLEIFGCGENSEQAMLMSINHLVESSLKGISFDCIKDLTFDDLMDHFNNSYGSISSPPHLVLINNKDNEFIVEQEMSVIIEEDMAYPILN